MCTRLMSYSVSGLLCALCVTTLVACGGGTTGTSPTDTLKLAGYAARLDGERAPGLIMSVRSGKTNNDLKDSGTDDQGDFSMDLPSDETSLIIDVNGVGATTIARQQVGTGSIATKLVAGDGGTVIAQDLFEAQIDTQTLCKGLTPVGNRLLISDDVSSGPCPVVIKVASLTLPISDFQGSVTGVCGDRETTVGEYQSSNRGELLIDLQSAFSQGCAEVVIAVSHPQALGLSSQFAVE